RIFELSEMVQRMQTLRFTTTWPDDYSADVYVATMKQLLRWAPECRTLYVTCALAAEELHIVSALMNRGGVVIVCPMAGGKK
ncbi:MAG TPA: hypothetical protein VFM05_00775, partial [Candidatus Saccharimonadales bacterium]|nr:hypothetical protein [Candidatus Saccharimonadales bacterium]